MSASKELLACSHPLFNYLISEEKISQEILSVYCSGIENRWNTIQFEDKNINDVIDYYNKFVNGDVDNDPTFDNSEVYLFIRYFILICALDTYGRCQGSEGLNVALERGKAALNGGLVSSLKRLKQWNNLLKAYGGEESLLNWMLNMKNATWFTKLEEENKKEITDAWHGILKEAFENN